MLRFALGSLPFVKGFALFALILWVGISEPAPSNSFATTDEQRAQIWGGVDRAKAA